MAIDRICMRLGRKCNSRDRVDSISLESNALTGKIWADLSLLREHLIEFDLTINALYHTVYGNGRFEILRIPHQVRNPIVG
jgi:hypothetical protein